MYRTRGKPEDPINAKAEKQSQELARLINVSPLNFKNSQVLPASAAVDKRPERIQNYDEFKKNYYHRLESSKNRIKKSKSLTEARSEYSIKKQYVQQNIVKVNVHKPAILRAPVRVTKTLKTVKVEVPNPNNERAVYVASKPKTQTKELRKNSVDEGTQVNLIKELQNINEQVELSNNQLAEINTILKMKRILQGTGDELNRTETREQLYAVHRNSKTVHRNNSSRSHKKYHSSKQHKLMSTLLTVNQRLQKIQEKYLSNTHPRYKSYRESDTKQRKSDPVQVLYENEQFEQLPSSVNEPHGLANTHGVTKNVRLVPDSKCNAAYTDITDSSLTSREFKDTNHNFPEGRRQELSMVTYNHYLPFKKSEPENEKVVNYSYQRNNECDDLEEEWEEPKVEGTSDVDDDYLLQLLTDGQIPKSDYLMKEFKMDLLSGTRLKPMEKQINFNPRKKRTKQNSKITTEIGVSSNRIMHLDLKSA